MSPFNGFANLLLFILITASAFAHEEIDLGLDFQMNSIAQLERAFDGALWGLSSTTQETMPTVAGVYTFLSTNNGARWDSSCVTPSWWRWGQEIAAISAKEAWVITVREDTTELQRTSNGGKSWSRVTASLTRISRPISIQFFSPKVGFILGQEGRAIERKWVVSRTSDGGVTWTTSIAMLAEPASEAPAERNSRSVWKEQGAIYIGMSSGRILYSLDSGLTWKFATTPVGGAVNSIGRISKGRLLAVNTSSTGVMRQATSTDNGASWSIILALPQDTPPLHGLRAAKDGSLLTIPNEYTKTALTRLSNDLSTAKILSTQPAYSVLEQADGTFLVGAEILPGQGIRKVVRK